MKKKNKTQPELVQPLNNNPDHSPVIPQRSKLKSVLKIYHRELTNRQKQFLALASDKNTKIIFVSGPAGSAKTYLSVLHALTMLNEKKVSDLIYVRSAIESSERSIGLLPGTLDEKVGVYLQPLMDKLEEFLSKTDIDLLKREKRITGMPLSFLRGLNWNAKIIIADEAQNMTHKELLTLITRTGEFSKVFVIGDPDQSDINSKSGFIKMMSYFDDEESRQNGIHVFRLTEDDIVRSGLVQFIIRKVKKAL